MLDVVAQNLDPVVLALLPDREFGLEEIGVVERSKRNGDQTVELAFDDIMHGRAAVRAKVMGDLIAAVGKVHPALRIALDRHQVDRPAGLGAEGAAGALLAIEAVANRHPHRLAGDGSAQLAAAARGAVGGHFASAFSIRRQTSMMASTGGEVLGSSSPTGNRSSLIRS